MKLFRSLRTCDYKTFQLDVEIPMEKGVIVHFLLASLVDIQKKTIDEIGHQYFIYQLLLKRTNSDTQDLYDSDSSEQKLFLETLIISLEQKVLACVVVLHA